MNDHGRFAEKTRQARRGAGTGRPRVAASRRHEGMCGARFPFGLRAVWQPSGDFQGRLTKQDEGYKSQGRR